jgi:bacillolysin
MKVARFGFLVLVAALVFQLVPRRVSTQVLPPQSGVEILTVLPTTEIELRLWDAQITAMTRAGELRMLPQREDTVMPSRQHERLAQYYNGVPIFGAEVTRQLDRGMPVSMFGTLYRNLDIELTPQISAEGARAVMMRQPNALATVGDAQLFVLPLQDGGFALTYRVVTVFASDHLVSFVDADSGRIHLQFSDNHRQIDTGRGRGVLGDIKKISTEAAAGTFRTADDLRPPAIQTYDMRGNLPRVIDILTGRATLGPADLAVDSDNDWTDGAVVDAHVYAGWTYDYLFKRFGRRGIDGNNLPIRSMVHPVSRDVPLSFIQQNSTFYINAFWNGTFRVMVYGVGLPPNIVDGAGRRWDYVSGGFDIVAHELAHGVTQFSSGLIYFGESGALNEAFSDIIGTGAEFYFAQQRGRAANYLLGDDVISGGGLRSMSDPTAYGEPDNYARRYPGPGDGAGVHINSSIANHAFYLAIEGGTNRTSGRAVQGVGGANREQIERIFYRAFTQMLPANSGYVLARLATIQSARDLFGAGSNAERAITQAWDAVGVIPPASPSLQFYFGSSTTPLPAGACNIPAPNFGVDIQVAETTGVPFDVTAAQFRFYNQNAVLSSTSTVNFAQLFTACGPGSNRIPAGGVACTSLCFSFGGAAGGSIDLVLSGRDANGVAGTFTSPRLRLGTTNALTNDTIVIGAVAPVAKQ